MNSARRVGAQSRAVTWPGLTSSWVLGLLATLSLELSNFYIDTVMNMEYLEYLEKEPWIEGGDKWVMSKFRQTTILRPFFDIFERLPKTQNFFF